MDPLTYLTHGLVSGAAAEGGGELTVRYFKLEASGEYSPPQVEASVETTTLVGTYELIKVEADIEFLKGEGVFSDFELSSDVEFIRGSS